MRWLLFGALFLAAGPALADGSLYMTWNECALDPLGGHNRNNPCSSNISSQALFCAFSPSADVDSILGVDLVVDMQASTLTLPSWWQFAPDSCRFGALTASFDFTVNSSCEDFWANQATGGVQAFYNNQPRGAASQARMLVSAAVLPQAGFRHLLVGHTYYGAEIAISNAHTVDPGGCGGCLSPVCLVFNSIALRRQPGVGDVTLDGVAAFGDNFSTWQSDAGIDCQAVPTRRVTWGRIQTLFR